MIKLEDYLNINGKSCLVMLRSLFTEVEQSSVIHEQWDDLEGRCEGIEIGIHHANKRMILYSFKEKRAFFEDTKETAVPFQIDQINKVYKLADGTMTTEAFLKKTTEKFYNMQHGFSNNLKELQKLFNHSRTKAVDKTIYSDCPYLYIILSFFNSISKKTKIMISSNEYNNELVKALVSLMSDCKLFARAENEVSFSNKHILIKTKGKKRATFKYKSCIYSN